MNRDELRKCFDFSSRTVAVTGGCGVLGGELVAALAWLGANVAVLDRSPELPEELVQKIEGASGKIERMYVDVLKKDTLVEAEETIWEKFRARWTRSSMRRRHTPLSNHKDRSFFL